jgi:hypothetical protein
MKMPSNKALMINGAAVMIIGGAAITQIKSYFFLPTIAACADRYPKAVALGVERNGVLLTASDVQAVAAGADSGIMENLTLMRVKGASSPNAIAVSLRSGTSHPEHTKLDRGGISFPWRPRALPQSVSAACLSYDVYLAPTFNFGSGGGTLPGLVGSGQNEKLQINFGWTSKGTPRMRSVLKTETNTSRDSVWSGNPIPRGRWVRVDQEIVLNAPKKTNGLLRVWLDGDLVAEKRKLTLRNSADGTIEGVLADVYFGVSTTDMDGRAMKDEQILFTPFELRWQ